MKMFDFFRNIEVFQLSCSCGCMNENPLFQVLFDNVCEGRTGADIIRTFILKIIFLIWMLRYNQFVR